MQNFLRLRLDLGDEGVMVRTGDSPYKCGRSTVKEGFLLKVKEFVDFEAEVVGFVEGLRNDNTLEADAFGRAKRSMKNAGMVPMGILGALVVKDCRQGAVTAEDRQFLMDNAHRLNQALIKHPNLFTVGTGFTAKDRKEIWDSRETYLGQLAKVKCQKQGSLLKPRFPVWSGFRSRDDL